MTNAVIPIELEEWGRHEPDRGSVLHGIYLEDDEARETAQRLTEKGILGLEELRNGLRIRATSFVGRIQLGPLEITVRPKIADLPLLNLLRYTYSLRDLPLLTSPSFGGMPHSFQDLVIYQLAAEAEQLIARGLHRYYQRRHESLTSPRGRPDVQAIARQGGLTNATIPSIYYPVREDTVLNQVVLAGLHVAVRLTRDIPLRTRLRRTAAVLQPDVTTIHLDRNMYRRAQRHTNRLTTVYRPALTLIDLLLDGQGTALDPQEPNVRLPGFLFDMQRFFEALLSRFLHDNLPEYRVTDQYRLTHMLAYLPNHNPRGRQAPTPRPDYVVEQDGHIVATLDAKYRDLWERELPRDMLYQLAIYALSQRTGRTATILYPTMDTAARDAHIEVRDPVSGQGHAWVVLRPVHLQELADLVSSRGGITAERERRAFAQRLTFGVD